MLLGSSLTLLQRQALMGSLIALTLPYLAPQIMILDFGVPGVANAKHVLQKVQGDTGQGACTCGGGCEQNQLEAFSIESFPDRAGLFEGNVGYQKSRAPRCPHVHTELLETPCHDGVEVRKEHDRRRN